jgi:hypothetical protein
MSAQGNQTRQSLPDRLFDIDDVSQYVARAPAEPINELGIATDRSM